MSEFHSVLDEFENIVERHKFVPLYPLWGKDYVSFSKMISSEENIYCYVIARGGNGFKTDVWVTSLDHVDDSLDSNCAAFKISIGSTYESDPEFFKKCGKRIENLLPSVFSLADAVTKELKNPSLVSSTITVSRRMIAYSYYMEAYDKFKKHPKFSLDVVPLIIGNHKKKRKSLNTISALIDKILPDILKEISPDASKFLEPFLNGAVKASSALAEFSYIEVLGKATD